MAADFSKLRKHQVRTVNGDVSCNVILLAVVDVATRHASDRFSSYVNVPGEATLP